VHDVAVTDPAVVLLIRHASAGDAHAWAGPDAERPLDERGRQQAQQITAALPSYQPVKVISAPARRCIDTVRGVADALGLPIEVDPLFGEEGAPADPERHLLEVAVPGAAVVVCSQGGVIPRMLEALRSDGQPVHARKGSVWLLTLHDGRLVRADEDVLG
jgi:8-oxo-dGTP diphosphatase